MRLICPNCDAQYEVDDAVIPDGGRDVQCSNCGHTWFQEPNKLEDDGFDAVPEPAWQEHDRQESSEESTDPDAPDQDDEADAHDGDDADEGAFEAAADGSDPEDEPVDEEFENQTGAPGQSVLARRQKVLDESILGILKEEAERETLARQRDSGSLETQADLGLQDPPQPQAPADPPPVQERTARLRGIEPDMPDTIDPTRRDLLPDIEDINSSLQSTSERDGVPPTTDEVEAQEKSQRRGFRFGFSLMILLIIVLILAYAYAPKVVETVPQSEEVMGQYVDLVNQGRISLNEVVSKVTDYIANLSAADP